MNNLENVCIDFVVDVLTYRPKDLEGKIEKYINKDKIILIDFISTQLNILEEYRNSISPNCYEGLKSLYEGLFCLLNNETI